MAKPMHVAVCGAGVIGACTAYYLARRGIGVTVVDCSGVASAASGKAGGFLALDWCAGTPLDALARRSFALHARLPEEVDGDWAYQRMTAYSGAVVADTDERRRVAAGLDWLSDGVIIGAQLSTTETTAIVHPRSFTVAMMRAAERHGASLRHGRLTGVIRAGASLDGIEVDGEAMRADAVVIAMGPWSLLAAAWLQLPPVYGQQSPSLVYDTGTDVPAEALFLEYQANDDDTVSVEVFPRADGSTHVTAFSSQAPLPVDPANVKPAPAAIDRLQAICERLSPAFRAEKDHRPTGLFPSADAGWASADRQGAA